MAEFIEVMKQRERMCKQFSLCDSCPIFINTNGRYSSCNRFIVTNPEYAEEIIMKWTEENPIMTNEDKFKEVFGFIPDKGYCPHDCTLIGDPACDDCEYKNFWMNEYKEPDKEKSNE